MPQDYRRATYSKGIRIGKPTFRKVYGEKRGQWATGTHRNPWQHDEYAKMPQISDEEMEARWNTFLENTTRETYAKSVEERRGKKIYRY